MHLLFCQALWVIEGNRPDDSWPSKGHIVVKAYSTRYRPGLDLVLKSVNFEVKAGEKVIQFSNESGKSLKFIV